MKTKVCAFLLTALSVLLVLLFFICVYANKKQIPDALFIIPKKPINTAVDVWQIEKNNGQDFMITYELNDTENVQALNNNHDVILKGTNYLYPYVMNRPIVAGSFFSKNAQTADKKLAVLNKKAAFDLFGTLDVTNVELKISGAVYKVIGVIDDKEEKNLNVYIPLQSIEDEVNSFSVLTNDNESNAETTIESKLKQYYINSNDFYFYNLNQFINGIWTKFFLLLNLLLITILTVIVFKCSKGVSKILLAMKKQSELYDFRELLYICRKSVISLVLYFSVIITMVIAVIISFKNAVDCILVLHDNYNKIISDYSTSFSGTISTYNQLSLYAHTVFIAFLILLTLFILLLLINYTKQKDKGKGL